MARRDAGVGEGGIDPEFTRTERSSDLFAGKRVWWGGGGSYLLRGPGWAVALFPSQGRGLFPGEHVSPLPLATLILVALLSSSCPCVGWGVVGY